MPSALLVERVTKKAGLTTVLAKEKVNKYNLGVGLSLCFFPVIGLIHQFVHVCHPQLW